MIRNTHFLDKYCYFSQTLLIYFDFSSGSVAIPVTTNGGAGSLQHIGDVVKKGNVSAVAVGSLVVYQKKGMGVLVNFPDKKNLARSLR